ncbi:MAG: hypothetical protein DLM66_01585 [Candidatus Dormiibacter spiritus]|nr:MAG: hypothetical protein DLM66_01585 [Candidatus Dormibacteraeota bacterium]
MIRLDCGTGIVTAALKEPRDTSAYDYQVIRERIEAPDHDRASAARRDHLAHTCRGAEAGR